MGGMGSSEIDLATVLGVMILTGAVILAFGRIKAALTATPLRFQRLETEVEALKQWRDGHSESCRAEHKDILDKIEEMRHEMGERMDHVDGRLHELDIAVRVLKEG